MRIFLIDDEFIMRHKLKRMLQEQKVPVSDIYEIYNEIQFYNNVSFDSINDDDCFFIDINLEKNFNGIDIAQKIRAFNNKCFIIFISILDNKGIEIINKQISPVGYIIKTESYDQIKHNLQLIFNQIRYQLNTLTDSTIIFTLSNYSQQLSESSIMYITTAYHYKNMILVHYDKGQLLAKDKLKNIKKNISSPYFFCDLKSYIINTSHLNTINTKDGSITFNDEKTLYVGVASARKILNFVNMRYEE